MNQVTIYSMCLNTTYFAENWKLKTIKKKKKLITVHPQNYLHCSCPINSIRDVELKKKEKKKKKMADANASHTNAIQT